MFDNRSNHFFSRMHFLLYSSAAALCLFAGANEAAAQTTTFAQFFQNGGGNAFQYSNNGTNGTFNATSVPLDFLYQTVNGTLPSDLSGVQTATLTLTSSTTAVATTSGSTVSEVFNNTSTLTITRTTAAAEGNGARDILLQVTFNSAIISGTNGGSGATLSASSTATSVVFSSDFLNFSQTTQRDLALSFSSVNPNFSVNLNQFLNSFTAAGSGTFSSNPPPSVVPEAASLWPVGVLLVAVGAFEAFRRSRRSVRS